jgi:hypothetical protein
MSILQLPPPTGGLQVGAAPRALDKSKAPLLKNFLCDQPGKLRIRGPLGTSKTIYSSAGTPTGIWVFSEKFLISQPTVTSKRYDTLGGGSVTDVTITSLQRLDGRSTRLGTYAYGPSTSSFLLRWDGSTSAPELLPGAPQQASDVATHLQRVFVAGGFAEPSLNPVIVAEPNVLWWTDIGGVGAVPTIAITGVAATDVITATAHGLVDGDPVVIKTLTGGAGLTVGNSYLVRDATANTFKLTDTAGNPAVNFTTDITAGSVWTVKSAFMDDASGLRNQLIVGDDGDEIVAIASIRGQLVVFKRHSIWTVLGDTTETFVVRQIAGTIGCLDKMSVTVVDGSVYFVDSSGIPRIYDGADFTALSDVNGIVTQPTAAWSCRLPNDHMLWMLTDGSIRAYLLFYIPTRAWSEFTVDSAVLSASATYQAAVTEFGNAYIFDGQIARPMAEITVGPTTTNDGLENSILPNAQVTYRTEGLSLPMMTSKIQQLQVDYSLTTITAGGTSFRVQLFASGPGLNFALTDALSSTTDDLQRWQAVINEETVDLIVHVSITPSTALTGPAELYDIWVEFSETQRR